MINITHKIMNKLFGRKYVTLNYAEEYITCQALIISGKPLIKPYYRWKNYENEPIIEALGIQKEQFNND